MTLVLQSRAQGNIDNQWLQTLQDREVHIDGDSDWRQISVFETFIISHKGYDHSK